MFVWVSEVSEGVWFDRLTEESESDDIHIKESDTTKGIGFGIADLRGSFPPHPSLLPQGEGVLGVSARGD